MKQAMAQLAHDLRVEMQRDGVLPRRFILTQNEAVLVRKVLGCVNTMYTIADGDYKPNKIDDLYRRLREFENEIG